MMDCSDSQNSKNMETNGSKANSTKDANSGNNSNIKQHKKSSGNKKSTKKQNQRKNNTYNARHKSGTPAIQQQNPQQPALSEGQRWDSELTQKIYSTMEKHKEVFFVVRLHSSQSAASLPPVNDPDPFISCDLMDGRDAFLTLAREKHYEFSSLRRAKFSSLAMLYELHNSSNDRFVYTCNTCKRHLVETRYHCTICDDFDLCVACYQRDGHTHPMDKLGFGDLVGGVAGEDGAVAGMSSFYRLFDSLFNCFIDFQVLREESQPEVIWTEAVKTLAEALLTLLRESRVVCRSKDVFRVWSTRVSAETPTVVFLLVIR